MLARSQDHKRDQSKDTVLGHPQEVQDPWSMLKHRQLLFTSAFHILSNYVIKIPLATAFSRAAHYDHPNISQSLNNRVV